MRTFFLQLTAWVCLVAGWRTAAAQDKGAATGVSRTADATSMSAFGIDHILLWSIILLTSLLLLVLLYWIRRLRREISDHRKVHEILEQREQELREVHSLAKIGHWQVDLKTKRLSGSNDAYRIFGISPGKELSLDDLVSRLHPQDLERISSAWDRALQQGSFDVEQRIVATDSVRWVRALAEIRFDDRGEPIQAVGAVQDITAIRQAESSYDATSRFLQAVTDAVGEGLFVLDREGRCVFVNPECERLLGWSEQELLGRDFHQLVHETLHAADGAGECPILGSLCDGHRRVSEDERFRRKDDTRITVRVVTVPLKEDRVISGAVVAFQDISERKQMETRLRASEERLSQLLESAPDAMLVSDDQGLITMVNQQTERLFGYSRNDLLGRHIEMLLPEKMRAGHARFRDRYIERAGSGGEHPVVSGRELIGQTHDGRQLPLEITLSPISTPQGLTVVSSMRDATSRKQAEEQIRKLSRAVEQSHSTIVITNLDAQIEFANPAFTRVTGYTLEDAIGQNPRILQGGEHGPAFYEEMWDTLGRDQVWQGELHNKRKDGSLYWEYASISPIKNEAGETTHYVAIKEDITVRREAQAKLRENERRLNALIQAIPDAVYFKDGEGRWQIVNSAGLELFKLQDKPWQGKDEMDLAQLQPEYREAHESCLASDETAWSNGGVSHGEESFITDDGERHFFDFTKIPIFSQEGQRKALVIVGRDVTEQRTFQERLKQAKEEAESANRAKSEFLANMSHELRTPMNAVLGFSSLLQETEQSPSNRGFLDAIQTSGKTLMQLIDDVLDLSKIEAGRVELHTKPVDLRELLRELEVMFGHSTADKELALWVDLDDAAADSTLLLDEVRLRQIVLNLIGNAVKFTDQGHVGVRVSLQPERSGHLQLTIAVEDTGIGIPEEQQNEIFDLFTQSKGQDPSRYGGTGLGLAISRRLARLMGGDIQLESEPDRGSVFTLSLPRVKRQLQREVPTREGSGSDLRFAPAEILIVDDILPNRLLMQGFLGTYGFTLREAENGEEALEEVRKRPPDLILMDILMPVLDGLEAAQRLKDDPATADIPILAVTASVTSERKIEIEATCDGYVGKPVSKEDLVETLLPYLPHLRRSANS